MRTLSLLTCAALTLAFAPAPLPKPDRGRDGNVPDLRRLQGTWQLMRYLNRNRDSPVGECQLRIAGSSATFVNRGNVVSSYELKLLCGARPRTMTWTDPRATSVERASFSLQGDTLKICWAAEPPADLAPGPDREYMELRRVR
jgi:uncharacterized protein (TIGR03067 family)